MNWRLLVVAVVVDWKVGQDWSKSVAEPIHYGLGIYERKVAYSLDASACS